jgi:AcrR family transcriptional regulator
VPNIKNNASAQETRRKLIEAAGEIFAERGLHAATIKDITTRAGVNCAAINYHFSDKFELYAAVIREALQGCASTFEVISNCKTPEEGLRAYITMHIDDMYTRSRPAWTTTLVAHELAQPTAALDAVLEDLIQPRVELMNGIIRDILGPGATEKEITYAGISIWGQCYLHVHHREVIFRLHPHVAQNYVREEIIEHITNFSFSALDNMRERIRQRETARK